MKKAGLILLVLALPMLSFGQDHQTDPNDTENRHFVKMPGINFSINPKYVNKLLDKKLMMLSEDFKLLIQKRTANLDKVVENAFELWNNDNSKMVTVTSVNDPSMKTRKHILDYLKAMQNLPYKNASVKYGDFSLINNITKGPDGLYHGFVEFTQEFSATTQNEGKTGKITDYSKRRVEVVIKVTTFVNKDGVQDETVQLFLGDMAVEESR